MSPPAGWPRDLTQAEDPEFLERVNSWLLDHLSSDFRQSAISGSPLTLAWVLSQEVQAHTAALRRMYATARGSRLGFDVDELLVALESAGAAQVRLEREVALVLAALIRLSGEMGEPHLD